MLITISPSGSDVVATGSGSLNLSALTPLATGSNPSLLLPSLAGLIINPGGSYMILGGISGPASWGPGSSVAANSASGDVFAIVGFQGDVAVPVGYVSGTQLSDSATFSNASLDSLGLTAGTYTYTWGSEATADSITVEIGAAAAPEPGTWMLLTCGAGLVALARRRKKA